MIYTDEPPNERPHVHVLKDRSSAKIWIDEISIVKHLRYSQKEVREILQLITENRDYLLKRWREIHG